MSETDNHTELFAKLKQHTKRVDEVADACTDEPKTEQYLVEPFLEVLGYDSRDPRDVVKRFTADVAGRKGEKVDYALMRDEDPVVLVEAKGKDNRLGRGEIEQLQRYFPHTPARLAVLTDGILWHWYKGRLEPERSHEMDSSPFLTYDAREPSEVSAEWLSQLTKDAFNPEELLRISRRNDFSDKISDWIHRTLVDPSDNAATEIRKAVGLDASSQETPLVVDAIRSAWARVVGGRIHMRGQDSTASEESDVADESANVPDSQDSTETPTVTSAGKLRFEFHDGEQLDIGGGETLHRRKQRRAWKIDGEEWRVEKTGTRLVTAVLSLMLSCDSRRDDVGALADQLGRELRVFEEPPRHWRWEPVPGFFNLYFNKNMTHGHKRSFLARVADNLVFDPPDGHPLRKGGKIEWWLPKMNV